MKLLILLIALLPTSALARPEYAAKQGVSCTSCHVSAWGGGPKTVYGKVFGSHGQPLGKFSTVDWASASVRGVLYEPKKPTQNMNGAALMEASASANVPVIEAGKDTGELRGVLTYNMAPLGAGVREAYGRYAPPTPSGPLPSYLTVGRFNSPFGLLTDEHRTYTRLQTNMTLNNFAMGAAASGAVIPQLGYDLAVVNDFQSGGTFTSKDLTWGAVLNLRWLPPSLPLLLGASQNYERTLIAPKPYATSVYLVLSIDRWSQGKVPASVSFECVGAHNWSNNALNPSIGSFFVPSSDAAYQTALTTSNSLGYLGMLKYEVTPRWTLLYKYDYLTLDENYPNDAFSRHGVGFIYYILSNLYIDTRVERAFVQRPELAFGAPSGTGLAAQDDLIAMLRLWL